MFRWISHRYAKRLSVVLLFAFGMVSVVIPLTGRGGYLGAQGQVPGNLPRVVVFDFGTQPGIDPVMGRKAADALALELTASGKYDVAPREQVVKQADTLGLSFPLDKLSQQRLASGLDATGGILVGRVLGCTVRTRPSRARVEIAVTHFDLVSGEPINGTRTVGDTGEKAGSVDPAALLDEAVTKAAYAAVHSMAATKLPRGIVQLFDTAGDITLNVGARDGVKPQMKMMVTRDEWDAEAKKLRQRRIGDIVVINVEPAHATARPLGGAEGFQTGDRVRAIFEMPSIPVREGRPPTVVAPKKKKKFRLDLGPLLALVFFLGGAGGGGGGAPAVTAAAGQVGPEGSTVVVTWKQPSSTNVDVDKIAGYFIYRSEQGASFPTLIGFVGKGITQFIDNQVPDNYNVSIDVDEQGYPTVRVTRGVRGKSTRGQVRQTRVDSIDEDITHTPVVPGTHYTYSVQRITGRAKTLTPPEGGGGTTTSSSTRSSQRQVRQGEAWLELSEMGTSGIATPLGPINAFWPRTSPPPDNVDPRELYFTFEKIDGADAYVVEVSPHADFRTSNRYQSPPIAPGSTDTITFLGLDATQAQRDQFVQALFPSGYCGSNASPKQFYWRVGARYTGDAKPPVAPGFPNNEGHVYNTTINPPWSFRTAQGPPCPPSGSAASASSSKVSAKRQLRPREGWSAPREQQKSKSRVEGHNERPKQTRGRR